jgi:hypothetical protein
MAETIEKPLKKLLEEQKIPDADIVKIVSYINSARRTEYTKKEEGKKPVTNNSNEQIAGLARKYKNLGLLVDGINVVITGRNMAMVTFNGYKNKVLQTYPETLFDIQLVRNGDTFSVAKESGSVIYSHNIGNPFGNEEIIGAYVVLKNKRGEFLETLNRDVYEKMKKASKQSYLWGEWESEFWLKSVIKRACKRHFYDVVADIDKNDNEDYGAITDDRPAPAVENTEHTKQVIAAIEQAENLDELKRIFVASGLIQNADVVAAKDARKEELTNKPVEPLTAETPPQAPVSPTDTPTGLKVEDATDDN